MVQKKKGGQIGSDTDLVRFRRDRTKSPMIPKRNLLKTDPVRFRVHQSASDGPGLGEIRLD